MKPTLIFMTSASSVTAANHASLRFDRILTMLLATTITTTKRIRRVNEFGKMFAFQMLSPDVSTSAFVAYNQSLKGQLHLHPVSA